MPSKPRAAGGKEAHHSPLADDELISLVRAGDAVAFAERHSCADYALSYRMTN